MTLQRISLLFSLPILLIAASCGGGGGGGGGGGVGGTTHAQILAILTTGGGGIGGSAVASGENFSAKAILASSNAPLSGIGVSLNDATGAVIASMTTGADGMAEFTGLAAAPTSVTFVDPVSREARTHAGSAQSPIRQVIVESFVRSPSFQVDLTGITPGADVMLMLNGSLVGSLDDASASESFSFSEPTENDGIGGLFGLLSGLTEATLVAADQPWLLIAHEYQNDTVGTPDTGVLLRAAYLTSSGGSPAGNPVQISLDLGSGSGTAAPASGVTSGLCTVGTATGAVAVGSSQFGFPFPNLAGLPIASVQLDNQFGAWNYSRLDVDTANIQSSLLAPPLQSSVNYSINYPVLPAQFTAGDWSADTRIALVALGSSAQFLAIAQGNFEDVLTLIQSLSLITRRFSATSVGAATNVSFASLGGPLGATTVEVPVILDTIGGAAIPGGIAALMVRLDTETVLLGFSPVSVTGGTSFPMIGRTGANQLSFESSHLFVLGGTAGDIGTGGASGYGVIHLPRAGVLQTGLFSPGPITLLPQNLALGGNLTLNTTSPAQTDTTFNLASQSIQWTGGGLSQRSGLFLLDMSVDATLPTSSSWTVQVNRAAVTTPGGSNYSFKIPTLPTTAPFSSVAITQASASLGLSISYVEVTNAAINLNSYTNESIGFPTTGTFLAEVLVGLPRISIINLIEPGVVDPE